MGFTHELVGPIQGIDCMGPNQGTPCMGMSKVIIGTDDLISLPIQDGC